MDRRPEGVVFARTYSDDDDGLAAASQMADPSDAIGSVVQAVTGVVDPVEHSEELERLAYGIIKLPSFCELLRSEVVFLSHSGVRDGYETPVMVIQIPAAVRGPWQRR